MAAVSGKRAKRYLQREHLLALGRAALEYLTELTHRRPAHLDSGRRSPARPARAPTATTRVRAAFARGLAEQAIGAEYIAHYLAAAVTTPPPIGGG